MSSKQSGTVLLVVIVVVAIAAFGAFYMFRSGTVKTNEMPVVNNAAAPVEKIAAEKAAAEGGAVKEAVSAGAEALTVAIKSFKFVPETITVNAGESVTWKNNDAGVPHSIVLDNGDYKSAAIFTGERETRRFPIAGTFPYHCGIHPSMRGTVVVE